MSLPFVETAYARINTGQYQASVQQANQNAIPKASAADDWGTTLWDTFLLLSYLLCFVLIAGLILKFIRFCFELYAAKDLVYIKVTLPRADSKLDKERETKKDFKEKVGIMSIFFKSIHKISSISFGESLMDFIFHHAKVSFEIAYNQGQVHFYLSTYQEYAHLITQQVTSNYPDAEARIISAKEYINLMPKGYTLRTASINKRHDDVYPIKAYKYFEDDPLSTFTNAFGNLKANDRAVIQVVVKPLGSGWNRHAKHAAQLVAKGQYNKGLKGSTFFSIVQMVLAPLYWIANRFVNNEASAGDTTAPGASSGDAYKIFNQAEQESHKMMGECAGQPGFLASIRLLVSSDTPESAKSGLSSLLMSTSVFTDEYNNKLDNPQIEDLFASLLVPVRYFAFRFKFVGVLQGKSVFSADELTTIYHFPDINYNRSPMIKWMDYKMLAPPHNLKKPKEALILGDYKRDSEGNVYTMDGSRLKVDENKVLMRDDEKNFFLTNGTLVPVHQDGDMKGQAIDDGKRPVSEEKQRMLGGFPLYHDAVLMGWNEYRNNKVPVYFSRKDRGRHHYVIGKSGGGKSVFLSYLARQDLWNGDGLCVVDPHGDLVEDIIAYTPKERAKDMIVFNPGDFERPMGLNMLEVISTDPELRAVEKDRAALDATSIFIKIFNEEIFGPRIQHYFRNGCLTLMDDEEDGGTLIDVPRLFVDDAFMRYKVSKVKNPVVKSFWAHEYANTGDREKQEMIPYFSAKFGPFITNTTIRNIIGQPKSAFNLRRVMDDGKALMVNLSKGMIGDLNAQLLGLIFVSKINMAAMSRADMPEEKRRDFFLYVDEFQNFATDTFGEILSEARKYRLALIMAHQFIAQIGGNAKHDGKPSIKDAVFGNAGTIMSFKVGAEDAEYLEKEYAPLLSQQDIIGIANYTTYCKLNIDNASSRPFDMKTIWDTTYKNAEVSRVIKEYSRKMYGRKKEYVDMEIEARLGIMPDMATR